MKVRYFWIGILLIVLSSVGNHLYFQSQQLKHPVFLDHYYEWVEGDEPITFYYLTNKSDPVEVNSVEMGGVTGHVYDPYGDGFMWHNPDEVQYQKAFTHHYLKAVTIDFSTELAGKIEEDEEWLFNEMYVYFTDGTSIKADIGEVRLVGYDSEQEPKLEGIVSGSSSNNVQSQMGKALEPMTIDAVSIPFSQIAADFTIKIDIDQDQDVHYNLPEDWVNFLGELADDTLPVHLNENDGLLISTLSGEDRTYYSRFNLQIKGETDTGGGFTDSRPIFTEPFWNERLVDRIIKIKTGE
ncbi:hypothetical protein NC661_17055 [Aquibacillus koreensis]|uniref:Uncharacterized protein n=1 Tax=Aquibacillus koreensis TaxID=279446 RepID=A0A9X3WNF9_9BACI|nr:hypothetical protein [Aquibacillus koreensis]MCT2536145.1 hypothetical protein [Aquibacillus koreensis]MDC3422070.1 hypothetical protein [Aquibacillus koreensis]